MALTCGPGMNWDIEWMSLKEGVGVSVSLPQHQEKKHVKIKTEEKQTEELVINSNTKMEELTQI